MQVGTAYGWRAAFALEGAAMLPLAAVMLLAPPVELRHGRPPQAGKRWPRWLRMQWVEATCACPLARPGPLLAPAHPICPAARPAGRGKSAGALLAADCRLLARSPVAMLTILALSAYNGALGCYAFYGPKAARDLFSLPAKKADLLFGGVTGGQGGGRGTRVLRWAEQQAGRRAVRQAVGLQRGASRTLSH